MPSKIVKNGRSRWKARVQINGDIRQKLFETRREALAWEVSQRQNPDVRFGHIATLRAWADGYMAHAAKYTRKTRNEKSQALRELFAARLPGAGSPLLDLDAPASTLTPGLVLAALQVQYTARGGNAANKDRKNLVAAWNWGMKYMNLPGPNPCRVERFPEQRSPRYVPPEADFWRVVALTTGQDRLMLLACLHLGARRGEIFALRWEDVDFANRRIRLATCKRRDGCLEYDWLPMTSELFVRLSDWQTARPLKTCEFVFACGNGVGQTPGSHPRHGQPFKERTHFMRHLCARAGVREFGFHAIRHLTASILYRIGQPLSVIQAILRHKSPTTTTIYLRSLGLEETREALESMARQFAVPDMEPPAPPPLPVRPSIKRVCAV